MADAVWYGAVQPGESRQVVATVAWSGCKEEVVSVGLDTLLTTQTNTLKENPHARKESRDYRTPAP